MPNHVPAALYLPQPLKNYVLEPRGLEVDGDDATLDSIRLRVCDTCHQVLSWRNGAIPPRSYRNGNEFVAPPPELIGLSQFEEREG